MNAALVSLKSMRIIHFAFLFTVILYVWVPSMMVHKKSTEFSVLFLAIFGMLSLTSAGAALFFQTKLVKPAAEQLRQNANDTQAAGRWRAGSIVCLVFSETIVLSGLVLRILGVRWTIAGIFYVVGGLLLILCTPKLELLPE